MRIAFDVHGVIDKYPKIIYPLIRFSQKMGNKICIVSGPELSIIKEDLEKIKFFDKGLELDNWTLRIYSVVDFLKKTGVKTWEDDKGDVWADDQSWWDSKAKICQKWEIDYMIDDSEKYRSAFDLTNCTFIHIDELL
jgi:hypothetical protein